MGIVQACSYISIGLGYLYLLFFPIQNTLSRYLLNMGIAGFFYFLLFLLACSNIYEKGVLIICLMVSGFAQAAAYPVVIKLIYQHFRPQ